MAVMMVAVIAVVFALYAYQAYAHHCGDLQYGFRGTKTRMYQCMVEQDLRRLARAERSWFAGHGSYTASIAALRFTPLPSVAITFGTATSTGWSATGTQQATITVCDIAVGSAIPPGAWTGKPHCLMR
jgi:hypothetical protein